MSSDKKILYAFSLSLFYVHFLVGITNELQIIDGKLCCSGRTKGNAGVVFLLYFLHLGFDGENSFLGNLLFCIGHNHQKFVTPQPENKVISMDGGANDVVTEGDIFVALVVAVGVIYYFEAVDIAHDKANGKEFAQGITFHGEFSLFYL